MKVKGIDVAYADGNHNAFTDICFFKGNYYLTFRNGTAHVSEDGHVLVLKGYEDGRRWLPVASVYGGNDTRDPKLFVLNDTLYMYSFIFDRSRNRYKATGFSCSVDGMIWSEWEMVEEDWVYWCPRVFENKVYVIAYSEKYKDYLLLKVSKDGRKWETVCEVVNKKGVEWPNEVSLTFKEDGTAYALVRREYGSGYPFLSQSQPPYKEWYHMELPIKLQGPLIWLVESEIWVAGRWYQPSNFTNTAIFRIDGIHPVPQLILPSGGDTSYAGIVKKAGEENTYLFSYYSAHEHLRSWENSPVNPANIYIAELELP